MNKYLSIRLFISNRCSLVMVEIWTKHFGYDPVNEIFAAILKISGSVMNNPGCKDLIRDMLVILLPLSTANAK